MRTFEQFIAEAIDEIGLDARVKSGQMSQVQADRLQQNRDRRNNSSALAIRPKPATAITKPNPGALNKPVTTAVTPSPKPNTSLVKPQSSSDRMDAKKEKIKDGAANFVADAPENLAKGAGNLVKKIGSQLLKKQEAPKLGVTGGQDLGGPQVFGAATR